MDGYITPQQWPVKPKNTGAQSHTWSHAAIHPHHTKTHSSRTVTKRLLISNSNIIINRNMTLWHRTVAKAVIRAEDTGRYFIIRSTIPLMPGWSLVGGGITKNEDPEQGLVREIGEELRVGRSSFGQITKRAHTLTSHHSIFGIPVDMTTHVFDVVTPSESSFEARTNWEVAESKWCEKNEALTLLGEHYRQLFTLS